MEIIKEMWEDGISGKLIFSSIVVTILGSIIMIGVSIENEKDWNKFIINHACKNIGEIDGNSQIGVGTAISSNGQVLSIITTTNTSSKKAYRCDDGITYWH